ncbi:hypothetical protein C9426_35115 [Serratia sp. S1B]|nr:hypothetical protein C9426_35115 [Serratia sp. S1B]
MQHYLLPVNNQYSHEFNKLNKFKIKKAYLLCLVGLISLFGVESAFACGSGTTQTLRTSGSSNTTENLTDCTSVVAPTIANLGVFTTAGANFKTNGSVFITNTSNQGGVRLFSSSGNSASFQGTADSHLSIFVINNVGTSGDVGALYSQWNNSTITGNYANIIAASSSANGYAVTAFTGQVLLDHGLLLD